MFKPYGKLNMQIKQAPNVMITPDALMKMRCYVDNCDCEIGWLGTCVSKDNNYLITDVFLFEQEAHGTTCEINEESVAKFMEDILNHNPKGVEICNTIRVWGHSHVRMGVTPSGQDDKQLEELARNSDDFFIRIIANKNGELSLDLWDKQLGVLYNNVQWQVFYASSVDQEAIKKEIAEKVKRKTYTPTYYHGQNVQSTGYRSGYGAQAQGTLYDDDYPEWYYSKGYGSYHAPQTSKKKEISVKQLEDCEKASDLLSYMCEDDIITLSTNAKREAYFAVTDLFPSLRGYLTHATCEKILKLSKEYVKTLEKAGY